MDQWTKFVTDAAYLVALALAATAESVIRKRWIMSVSVVMTVKNAETDRMSAPAKNDKDKFQQRFSSEPLLFLVREYLT